MRPYCENMTQLAKHHSGNNAADNGFTIIEALIAIILFTITLAGGLAIYINADRITTLATHKRLAVEIANLRMEELRAMSYTAFGIAYLVSDPTVPEVFPPDVIPPVGDFVFTRTIMVAHVPPVATPDYKEVTINVSWTEADQAAQARAVEIKSIIAP